jgi:ATP-dependent RNA helicase RhlE
MSFESLNLNKALLKTLAQQGYSQATPVQLRAIPVVLEGRDLMAAAQTGTGKTAAFALPVVQRLASTPERKVIRALVLTPTRELAAQVCEHTRVYAQAMGLSCDVVYGGVKIGPQISTLRRGLDILVATPGRLLDLHQQGMLDLTKVQVLILDEADRMLDMGFIHDIRRIIKLLPQKRQNLLFSATLSSDIRQLAGSFLDKPLSIDISPETTSADTVKQWIHRVDKTRKAALLSHLIWEEVWDPVLVFTATKHGADRLAKYLEKEKITAMAIHGNKKQGARNRALQSFKDGKIRALVATDVAARGLDIEQLPIVVNYDLPNIPEDYVHRIGRTGRAGMTGQAVSLVSLFEIKELADIERLLKTKLERIPVAGFEPSETEAEVKIKKEQQKQQKLLSQANYAKKKQRKASEKPQSRPKHRMLDSQPAKPSQPTKGSRKRPKSTHK